MNSSSNQIDKIIKEEDFEMLFSLEDNGDFSVALHEILVKRYDKNAEALNPVQLNLFLCMYLENAGQSGHILSFLQEWFPEHQKKVVASLNEIGAVKSAELIARAVEVLPEDGSWFSSNSDQDSDDLLDELNDDFSDYPDGPLCDLYREYANRYREFLTRGGRY